VRGQAVSSDQPIRSPIGWLLGAALSPLRSTATIASVFLVSLGFVLGLVTLLDCFKFQSTMTDLADRRIGIIIARAHNSLETAIDLGLNLRVIGIGRIIAGSTEAEDRRIKNTYVFSTETGRILFSSDPAVVGSAVDRNWLAAQAAAGAAVWRIKHDDHILVGERLDSDLADTVGGVVLDYSLEDVGARVAAMRNRLVWAAIVTFLVFSIVAVGGAIVVTREFRRILDGLAEAIGSAAAPATAMSIPDPILSSVDRFKRTTSEAHSQLDRVEDALARSNPSHETSSVGAIG
jgi:hypothetical protein